jgi:hypothetical protein
MMRRIAIVIMAQTLVAVSFLAAKPSSQAQTLPAVTGDPIPGVAGYGVELGLSPSSGKILELLVYQGQKQVQALKVCTPEPVPRESLVGNIYYADYNFDGHSDLALETASKQGNASYCIWLFNPNTRRFEFSQQLSQLTNPSPDAQTHTVISYSKGECQPCYHRESYRWSNGQLMPVREESIAPADLGLQAPGGCGWLHTVREEKNGKMVFVSRSQVNSLGQDCLPGQP